MCTRNRSRSLLLPFWAAFLFVFVPVGGPVHAAADPATTCLVSKHKAAAKLGAAEIKCAARAAIRGFNTDPECLAKADQKFSESFAAAEARGGCTTTGDSSSVEAIMDQCVADVRSALGVSAEPLPDSDCATLKLKGARKNLKGKFVCDTTSVRTGAPVDPACMAKADSKYDVLSAKAETKSDCVQTGDANALQNAVDNCVAALGGALPTRTPTLTRTPSLTPTVTLTRTVTQTRTPSITRTPTNTIPPPCGDPEPPAMVGVTNEHNITRANAFPPPIPALPPVCWSASISATAQAWADGCQADHNPNLGALNLGENLFFFAPPGTYTPVDAVESWSAEAANYNYASNSCAPGEDCGHYTQVVWRDTNAIGCGIATCNVNSPFPGVTTWAWVVCDYSPPGNWEGERPY